MAGFARRTELHRGADEGRHEHEGGERQRSKNALDGAAEAPQPVEVEGEVPEREVDEGGRYQGPVGAAPHTVRGQVPVGSQVFPRRLAAARRDQEEERRRPEAECQGDWGEGAAWRQLGDRPARLRARRWVYVRRLHLPPLASAVRATPGHARDLRQSASTRRPHDRLLLHQQRVSVQKPLGSSPKWRSAARCHLRRAAAALGRSPVDSPGCASWRLRCVGVRARQVHSVGGTLPLRVVAPQRWSWVLVVLEHAC